MRINKRLVVCGFTALVSSLFLSLYVPVFAQNAQAAGETVTIQITGTTQPPGFLPALVTVHVYDTVIFVNRASPVNSFSIVADDGLFSSPEIAPGKQWIVTFNTPGEHEYHTSTHSQRMVGIIIVVPDSVHLLATPAPEIEATVVALIKAGKTPPDTLIVPTPTPVPLHTQSAFATSPFNGWLFPGLLIGGVIIALLALSTGGFYLFRWVQQRWRKRHANDELDEEDENDEDDENI